MFNEEYFHSKRWFKGKQRKISKIQTKDFFALSGNTLYLIAVSFENEETDLYAVTNYSTNINDLIFSLFDFNSEQKIFKGSFGELLVKRFDNFDSSELKKLTSLNNEQSNSSFIAHGNFFFKLFRRISPGIHPEEEILLHLKENNFTHSPNILGTLTYYDGNASYSIGILESAIKNACSAWDYFQGNFSEVHAALIGKRTAEMHKALAKLPGENISEIEVPFQKLETLLKQETKKKYTQELLQKLPELEKKYYSLKQEKSILPCQRIHGDFHLGQILYNKENFWIIDFEGEPSREITYRRSKQSVAVDIAGMLRSFQYAKAMFNKDTTSAELAFLEAYAKYSGINKQELQNDCKAYCLAKAIYEACYELEFRPDWFFVPATALLKHFL